MSNSIYNQQRMLSRHLKRLEVARQLNSKLRRKSARMLKVTKHLSRASDRNADLVIGKRGIVADGPIWDQPNTEKSLTRSD
jgi:hypothetical protein